LRGLGGLLTGLLALTAAMIVVQLVLRVYGTASGQFWGSRLSPRVGDAGEAAFFLTAIVFVVWFRRARINAESSASAFRCPAPPASACALWRYRALR
jgi:hypothetical protein